MANTSINLVDLDFNSQKNSLKNYLRDNKQFADYDYDGANINVLLDLLSYNTFKNAFYLNMILSESFLDSAQLRNSVFSHAKELNYLPRSARSASARIKVDFSATGESAPYTILKGSQFTSIVKNTSYTFTIDENLIVSSTNNDYSFEADIYEGVYITETFTYVETDQPQLFKLSNLNVDTSSITVQVYENNNTNFDTYTFASSLLGLNENSKKFFIEPNQDGFYQILFGDNNVSRRPRLNSTIVISYRTSSGTLPNGAKIFSIDFDPTNADELTNTPVVNTLQNAKDGSESETIESIKYIAPRHFQTQERCVTSTDYKITLQERFSEINTLYAYGGEELNPPLYGKVFVAVDITNVDGLPDFKKFEYEDFLRSRMPFGIIPEVIEPERAYLRVNTLIRYNINVTSDSRETIRTRVRNAITAFRDTYLDDFNVILRQSKLEAAIDDADQSIVSSITTIDLYKSINPTLGQVFNQVIEYGVAIRQDIPTRSETHDSNYISAVSSSVFLYNSEFAVVEDDGAGKLWIVRRGTQVDEKIIDAGTIDYETGTISLVNFRVDRYLGSALKIYVKPADPDVVSKQNNILSIDQDDVTITLQEISE